MQTFRSPQINLYSKDIGRALTFYEAFGFIETFRTPSEGPPDHVELRLDGLTLGVATADAARNHHGLAPSGDGRWLEIVLWADDVDAAWNGAVASGTPSLSPPHDFLGGKLRAAWIADPDGNPIQFVQKKG